MKKCSKCKSDKPETQFWKSKIHNSGLRPDCVDCCRARGARWRARNKDHIRAHDLVWRLKNKARISHQRKAHYLNNREKVLSYSRNRYPKIRDARRFYHAQWYRDNKAKEIRRVREWGKRNPDKIKVQQRKQRVREKKLLTNNYVRNILRLNKKPLTAENMEAVRIRIRLKRAGKFFQMANAASTLAEFSKEQKKAA